MNQAGLVAADPEAALRFFYWKLRKRIRLNAADDEVQHVSSVLAHYTMVSRHYPNLLPAPANLTEVFDNFIYTSERPRDPEIIEHAAAQTLLLNGFFRTQMERRHSVEWFDSIGSTFYLELSCCSESEKRKELFARMAHRFHFWALNCSYLAQDLRESRYLLS